MVDTELIANQLRAKGYTVTHIEAVSENSGDYIFLIDGESLNLEAARALLEDNTASS